MRVDTSLFLLNLSLVLAACGESAHRGFTDSGLADSGLADGARRFDGALLRDSSLDSATRDGAQPDIALFDDGLTLDSGATDGAIPDSAAAPDAAAPDTSPHDTSPHDASVVDAAQPDAAVVDAALPDAAVIDAAPPDAAVVDAALPDAAQPDASLPDAMGDGSDGSTADAAADSATNDATTSAAKIVITEILADPVAVNDSDGEWFEIYNAGSTALDLKDWVIKDQDNDFHVIASSLVVLPGHYAVLGRNANSATNGGVTVHYQYSGFTLGNTADEIVLLDANAAQVDIVQYVAGAGWSVPAGASIQLSATHLPNNNPAHWCVSQNAWGLGADKGTPGSADDCP